MDFRTPAHEQLPPHKPRTDAGTEYILFVALDGDGRPRGEEPYDVTAVQMFRQDARRGKASFELWK